MCIYSCHAFASDLETAFGKVGNNNLTLSIVNHNPSESFLLKSIQVDGNNNVVCYYNNKETNLSPQKFKTATINSKICFGLDQKAKLSGVSDVSNSLATPLDKNLLRKDVKVIITYSKDSSKIIEREEKSYVLLFMQR